MKKKFIEYYSESEMVPYSSEKICFCLTELAKDYIKKERKLIANVDEKVRDAVLTNAINYLASKGLCNFGLFTKHLYEDVYEDKMNVDSQILLTIILNFFSMYIFDYDFVASVLRDGHSHMNECKKRFNASDGALVVTDFINYITELNGYDKTFTIKDLYEKFKIERHIIDRNLLSEFLELSNKYSEKIINGEDINSIFQEMTKKHNLKYIDKKGNYYTNIKRKIIGKSKMYSWEVREVEKEIYAMAYAYAKLKNNEYSNNEVIDRKILEMKKR